MVIDDDMLIKTLRIVDAPLSGEPLGWCSTDFTGIGVPSADAGHEHLIPDPAG